MRIGARRRRGGVMFMTHKKAVHKQQQNPKTIHCIRPPTSPSASPISSNSASTASSFRFFSFALSYERARVRKCVCLLCRATFQHGEPAASCAQTLQSLCFHRYFCPTPTIKLHARDSIHANTLTLMHNGYNSHYYEVQCTWHLVDALGPICVLQSISKR